MLGLGIFFLIYFTKPTKKLLNHSDVILISAWHMLLITDQAAQLRLLPDSSIKRALQSNFVLVIDDLYLSLRSR